MSVQRFNKSQSDTQPYHLYYDMNVINNDSSFPSTPVRFQYKETRSNYFLQSPQDYFMSIVRFNLQTPTLPVFIPQINLNPNNTGGLYPVQSMSGTSNQVPFVVNLFVTSNIPVGSVLYLGFSNGQGYSGSAPYSNRWATQPALANNYYKVLENIPSPTGQPVSQITLSNPNATLAVPNSYASQPSAGSPLTFNPSAGQMSLSYAVFNVTNIVFDPNTAQMTISLGGNFVDLQPLLTAGNNIYLQNIQQYSGNYKLLTVNVATIVVSALELRTRYYSYELPPLVTPASWVNTGGLQPYVNGGTVTSAGDIYNETPYTTTMSFLTGNVLYKFTAPVVYTPNDLTTTPPIWNPNGAQALSLQEITSSYYWVYTYELFIQMVNNALTNVWWGLSGCVNANNSNTGATAGTYLPTSYTDGGRVAVNQSYKYPSPAMSWNQSNLTAILTGDNQTFSTNVTSTQTINRPVSMYFNQPLSTLFDSFPYLYSNVTPDSPLWSQLLFSTNAGAGLYVVSNYSTSGLITPAYTAIQIYQDHQTASLMNPVQSIVFTSTLLPVVMENVGTPLILNGTSTALVTLGSTANIFPVVTDFVVPFSSTNGYVPDITYVPSGEYRLVDLYGESPCNQVDIQVFWKNQYGLITPFTLGSGASGSLKLMFRRKDYNDVSIDN